MRTIAIAVDTGTGYGRKPGGHNAELTEVGPGTPMGELMRRWWMPVALSSRVAELPQRVRVLGEDLVLFRDKAGRAGLLDEHCAHRGTSLFFGRIDDHGLRCCYHGWAFDVQGRCTDQPCEPQRGQHRDRIRQAWYPVEERYGLVFAYLGPPEKKPLLPRYECLETLQDGEQLFVDDHNIGSGRYFDGDVPFNWLQHYENILDFGHFLWLHYFHSGPQFGSRYGELDKLDFDPWTWVQKSQYSVTPRGVISRRRTDLPDGRVLDGVVETVLPTVRGVPNPLGHPGAIDNLGFVLPIDDTHHRIFNVLRGRDDAFFQRLRSMRSNRDEMLAQDPHHYQKYPGDWEAQGTQGAIANHAREHLATSDRGIVMLRRLLKQQVDIVRNGGDPIGVAYEPGSEVVRLEAGQFLSTPEPAAA